MGTDEYKVMLNSEHEQGLHQTVKHTMCKKCFPELFRIEEQQEQYEAFQNILREMKRLGICRVDWEHGASEESIRNEINVWTYDHDGGKRAIIADPDFWQLHPEE